MLVLAARVEDEPSAAPFGEAIEAFEQVRQYLCSSEARKMSESEMWLRQLLDRFSYCRSTLRYAVSGIDAIREAAKFGNRK